MRLSLVIAAAVLPAFAQTEVSRLRVQILSTMLTGSQGIGEWGFSAVVEAGPARLLFDTGARPETVLVNARELKVDLAGITDVILTHNHGDHTGGLLTLRREHSRQNKTALSRVWAGAGIFDSIAAPGGGETNSALLLKPDYEALGGKFSIVTEPSEIAPGVWLTGPVPRRHPERNWSGSRQRKTASGPAEDTLQEDSSLVVLTPRGLVIVTGCGHAGIINTIEHARDKIRRAPVYAVIGGMHLFQTPEDRLDWTASKLKEFGVQYFLGAHCTGIEAALHIRSRLGLTRKTAPIGAVGAVFDIEKGIEAGAIAR